MSVDLILRLALFKEETSGKPTSQWADLGSANEMRIYKRHLYHVTTESR